jgi:hypothetical protein
VVKKQEEIKRVDQGNTWMPMIMRVALALLISFSGANAIVTSGSGDVSGASVTAAVLYSAADQACTTACNMAAIVAVRSTESTAACNAACAATAGGAIDAYDACWESCPCYDASDLTATGIENLAAASTCSGACGGLCAAVYGVVCQTDVRANGGSPGGPDWMAQLTACVGICATKTTEWMAGQFTISSAPQFQSSVADCISLM